MPQPSSELLTADEVAVIFRVTGKTIRNWADEGRLRHIILPNRQRRFRRIDVEEILTPIEPTEAAS